MKKLPKIRISLPFCLLISLLYALDFGGVFAPTLIAVFIHESAHVLAIKLQGWRIDKVEVSIFGVSVNVPELEYMPYSKEMIIAAAGPLAGIATAGATLVAAKSFGINTLDYFIGVNVVITAINLLPVYPLDGGRIALCLLVRFMTVRGAYAVSYVLSIVSIGVLFGACVLFAYMGRLNPTLVIFFIFVAISGIKARPRLS